MPVSMSLDDRITALVPNVDGSLRTQLQKLLKTLRDVDYPEGVLSSMMRLGLRFMKLFYASQSLPLPSKENLYKCIEDASDAKLLPTTIASYLHLIRVLRNKPSKSAEEIRVQINDAENALGGFLRILEWFYCEYDRGPRFETIYSTEPSPQEVIRGATASDCSKIKFLGGEGDMSNDFYRRLTIRGRRPDDQSEIAQAVENLISETLQERVGRLASSASLKRRTEESDLGESWPIVSLDDRIIEKCAVEPKGQLRALLLTDEPGGGKSTTARNVAWRVAKNVSPFENERRLPIYVRLRDWENSHHPPSALASYLGEVHANDSRSAAWPPKTFWEKALGETKRENGQLFLIFDGLDELSSNKKFAGELLDEVQTWARQGNVVLITCRTRSLGAYKSKLNDFEILRINGFNPEEILQFVYNYPNLKSPEKLIDELRQQPALLQLVRDPFLLDVICFLAVKDQGKLPECRSELIEKAIDQLLLEVDLSDFHWPDDNEPTINIIRRVLARASLLLRLQEAQGNIYNLFNFDRFENSVQTALQQESFGTHKAMGTVLTRFYSRTRFLQFPTEPVLSKETIGSFSHSLFLDFLAAEGLRLIVQPSDTNGGEWDTPVAHSPHSESAKEFVTVRAFDPAWFESLSFLPSRLGEPVKYFELLCNEPDDLSRRRATLAIRSLGELPSDTLKSDDVRQWAEPIAQSCWDIAAIHWGMGVTSLAEALIAEISSVSRVHPGLIERLAKDLHSPDLRVRLNALTGLDRIGMAAAPFSTVIEGLLFNLRDRNWSLRKLTSATLAKMGPFAVKPIVERLTNSDEWYEQASACEAIGLMGELALTVRANDVITLLLELLDHKQPLVRASACEALGGLGSSIPNSDEVVRKMAKHAGKSEKDPTVRAQACTALGKFGAVAASSIAVLNSLMASLAHDDWVVRTSASSAISDLARETTVNKSHIVDKLTRNLDYDPAVRASVCQTLGKLHSVFAAHTDTITSLLTTQIGDEDIEVCMWASAAIRNLGIKITDRGIFKRLLDLLEDADWQIRARAVEALGNLGDSLADEEQNVLNHLFKNLRDSRWYVRSCSCEVLGHLASILINARPVITNELMKVLNPSEPTLIDTEGYVSVKALKALGKVGLTKAQSTATMQRMATFLEEDNWQVQVAACEAFRDIGPDAAEIEGVVHGLTECLKSKVWCVRANACKTLGRMLPVPLTNKNGIEELVACVCDGQQPVRTEAAETVSRLTGAGNLGVQFVLDTQQKILVARRGTFTVEIPFPKPTPPLFAFTLPLMANHDAEDVSG